MRSGEFLVADADCGFGVESNGLILRCEGESPSLEERTASQG